MRFQYRTKGTCSSQILFEVEEGKVRNISYIGGCNGNLQGISKLIIGQKAEDVIPKIEGIRCGFRNTSCPDQLSKALKQAIAE